MHIIIDLGNKILPWLRNEKRVRTEILTPSNLKSFFFLSVSFCLYWYHVCEYLAVGLFAILLLYGNVCPGAVSNQRKIRLCDL
jgi:hypothetical protein